MSDALLNKLLERLEHVTARLERVEGQMGAVCPAAGGGAAPKAAAVAGESGAASVSEFDAILAEHVAPFVAATASIGSDELKEQVAAVEAALKQQRQLLNIAAQSKKPDAGTFAKLIEPTSTQVMRVIEVRDKNRGHKQWNHLSALSEGIPALGWVGVSPTPGPYANEYRGNSEFYSNKLLREYKGKDDTQVAWVNGWNGFLKALIAWIKKYHTTELAWNAKGGDASAFSGAAAAPAGGPPAGGPPPPPPADFAKNVSAPKKSAGGDVNALFAAINKGGAVTSGLKKVDRSQMTHKNPSLRAGSKVSAEALNKNKKKPAAAAKKFGGGPRGTPKFELEGNKWVIEFHNGNRDIHITDPEPKHTVYIYGLQNCVVKIDHKVNSIAIDSCKKVAVCFNNAIACCEIVNSQSIEVQCLGKVPAFTIDKCAGANLYLSKECLDCEIVQSKSDQMNVSIPGEPDPVEMAVPEQFKTVIVDGKLITSCVEHV